MRGFFVLIKFAPIYYLPRNSTDLQLFRKCLYRVSDPTGFSLVPVSEIYFLSPGTIPCLFFSLIRFLAERMNDFYF